MQSESNMDWAAVEEMMPIFEAANLIMYRDGVVYFIYNMIRQCCAPVGVSATVICAQERN